MTNVTSTIGSNRALVHLGNRTLAFSYSKLVAVRVDGQEYVERDSSSVTTARHITQMGFSRKTATPATDDQLDHLAQFGTLPPENA